MKLQDIENVIDEYAQGRGFWRKHCPLIPSYTDGIQELRGLYWTFRARGVQELGADEINDLADLIREREERIKNTKRSYTEQPDKLTNTLLKSLLNKSRFPDSFDQFCQDIKSCGSDIIIISIGSWGTDRQQQRPNFALELSQENSVSCYE